MIKDRSVYKNILFALITLFLLFFVWLKYLDIYTNHNDFIKVPDFRGIDISVMDSVFESLDLQYVVIDSIFDKSRKKGVVVNQEPASEKYVKENRKIYLTINSLKSRKVIFPDVFDLTLRQAVRKLKKNGLRVGKLEYRADIATNKVLGFKVNGIAIDIGQELYHNTVVDLILGKGISSEKVIVPNLIGLSRIEANIILKSVSLNIGLEYFKEDVIDSGSAVIYWQYPEGIDDNKISIGSSLDLYFKKPLEELNQL